MSKKISIARVAATTAAALLVIAGFFTMTYLSRGRITGRRPDVSVGPGKVDGGQDINLYREGDTRRSLEDHTLDHYFSILQESEEPLDRRSAAFRINYLATSKAEDRLLQFLADDDEMVARHCSEALIRIWQESDSPRTARFFQLAHSAWETGDFPTAKSRLENITILDPGIPDTYRLLAAVLIELDETERAIQAARKALELKPEHFAAHRILAMSHLERGEKARAVLHLDRALELYPTCSKAAELRNRLEEE